MNISEAGQELLESLWIDIVEEKNEHVKVKDLGQEDAVKELVKAKCIMISSGEVHLTPEGLSEARTVIRRHRLAERLLHDVLDVSEEDYEESACKFEHIISAGVEESICILLGHPRACPHGKSVPPGRCCREGLEVTEKVVSSLSRLREGQQGRIVYILTKNHKNLKKLLAMGVLPGMSIKVIQTYPSHVFQIGKTQIAVDSEIANDIFVRVGRRLGFGKKRRRHRFRSG